MKKNILFVEDDEVIRENYREILENEGFEVAAFDNRQDALTSSQDRCPDIALLDIALGNDRSAGYRLCIELRRQSEILPIIFLTSHDSEVDKISGIRLGADDYLTKDTSVNYLVARIDALLARVEVLNSAVATIQSDICQIGELSMDGKKYNASWKDIPLNISLTQFWILQEILVNPGEVKSADQLMKAASITVEPNTIASHIKSIRKQFREIDSEFNHIKTEYSAGYRWLS